MLSPLEGVRIQTAYEQMITFLTGSIRMSCIGIYHIGALRADSVLMGEIKCQSHKVIYVRVCDLED